jgi:demethylmenaquinone methyltransferase/2-methoxy-6-polyprenyl-1,4-benzoquinol methylase
VEGWWEHRARILGLKALDVRAGERVLEIGPGTGRAFQVLAEKVGPNGRAYGLDLAEGMLGAARARLTRAGQFAHVRLIQGDGAHLPLAAGIVDAVFMSFVLELFDTPEIPQVLAECRRVLRSRGRLGVVSLLLPERPGLMVTLYEGGHRLLPRLLDCRPIPVLEMLAKVGFSDTAVQKTSVWGLPVVVAVARAR